MPNVKAFPSHHRSLKGKGEYKDFTIPWNF